MSGSDSSSSTLNVCISCLPGALGHRRVAHRPQLIGLHSRRPGHLFIRPFTCTRVLSPNRRHKVATPYCRALLLFFIQSSHDHARCRSGKHLTNRMPSCPPPPQRHECLRPALPNGRSLPRWETPTALAGTRVPLCPRVHRPRPAYPRLRANPLPTVGPQGQRTRRRAPPSNCPSGRMAPQEDDFPRPPRLPTLPSRLLSSRHPSPFRLSAARSQIISVLYLLLPSRPKMFHVKQSLSPSLS